MSGQIVRLYEDMITASSEMRETVWDGYRVVTMAATPKHGVIVVYEMPKEPQSGSRDLMDDIKTGKGLPPLPKREWE